MMLAPIRPRLLTIALLLVGLAPGLAAQSSQDRSFDTRVFDPLTGEPVPLGLTVPPTETVRGGGGELNLRQYLPEGSTKLARAISPRVMLYQNGATLTLGGLNVEDAVIEIDHVVLDAQPADADARGETIYLALRKEAGLAILDADPFEGKMEIVGHAPSHAAPHRVTMT